ncbi:MAG: ArnT family glycosyltransferase [Anaerolineae bacterium]
MDTDRALHNGTGWYLVVATVIMLIAAGMRLWGLTTAPPGLSAAEIGNILLPEQLLSGELTLIYDQVSPAREGMYHAVLAITSRIYGSGILMWRLPSVWIALLSIALTIRMARKMFGVRVGLLPGGLMAVVFWPVWLGRAALHATLMPLLAALTFYTFSRAYVAEELTESSLWFTVGGLVLGFALYAHVTAWTLILTLSLYVIYRTLIDRDELARHWSNLVYAGLLMLVLSLPLALFLLNNPGVREPVPLAQQPDLLVSLPGRFLAVGSAFALRGDLLAEHNIPGRPVLDPVLFGLTAIGVGVALARWKQPQYGLILLWLVCGLIPTALLPAIDFEILAVVMPVLFIFPAVGLRVIYRGLLTITTQQTASLLAAGAAGLLVITSGVISADAYFRRWANDPQVAEAYNADMAALARLVDTSGLPASVCSFPVGPGPLELSNYEWLNLMAHSRDLRAFDCRTSLVLAEGGETQVLIFPRTAYYTDLPGPLLAWMQTAETVDVPHNPPEAAVRLDVSGQLADRAGAFITTAPTAWPPEIGDQRLAALPITFENNVDFLGYQVDEAVIAPGESVAVVTYWRLNGPPPDRDLTMFAHLLSNPTLVIAQIDGFGVQTGTLQPRDIVLHQSIITTPEGLSEGFYPISVGLYAAGSTDRFSAYEAGSPIANRLFLQRVEVISP